MRKFIEDKPIKSSEITPESLYLSRRQFIKRVGLTAAGAAGAALLAACGVNQAASPATPTAMAAGAPTLALTPEPTVGPPTAYDVITNYNNFYEFSTDKGYVAELAKDFKVKPWSVAVSGLVQNPKTYSIEEILQKFPREERIYRLRCVEGWSMVIPWTGFQLNKLLEEVQPLSTAKYVRFTTIMQPETMIGLVDGLFPWPYTEGLRMDEAMHDLTLLATGLYGKEMPNQDGAPIRLVVPWKYGFKSIKSIIKIELVTDQPATFWDTTGPNEYGFYSNVNPNVPHPRWSQETERPVGGSGRQPTLMFNGYAQEVAHLYDGMDLVKNY